MPTPLNKYQHLCGCVDARQIEKTILTGSKTGRTVALWNTMISGSVYRPPLLRRQRISSSRGHPVCSSLSSHQSIPPLFPHPICSLSLTRTPPQKLFFCRKTLCLKQWDDGKDLPSVSFDGSIRNLRSWKPTKLTTEEQQLLGCDIFDMVRRALGRLESFAAQLREHLINLQKGGKDGNGGGGGGSGSGSGGGNGGGSDGSSGNLFWQFVKGVVYILLLAVGFLKVWPFIGDLYSLWKLGREYMNLTISYGEWALPYFKLAAPYAKEIPSYLILLNYYYDKLKYYYNQSLKVYPFFYVLLISWITPFVQSFWWSFFGSSEERNAGQVGNIISVVFLFVSWGLLKYLGFGD